MDERIEFNDNSNGKLNCQFFPLIRLHNQIKNAVGSQKQIYLKGVYKGNAKILTSRSIKLADITDEMAMLNSGIDAESLRKRLKATLRHPSINWDMQLLDYLVLGYTKESREPKLL